MRHIQSCILQLLVDADQPSSLRGRLSMDREGEEWSFRNEESLVEVLHRVRNRSIKRLEEREQEQENGDLLPGSEKGEHLK